MLSDDIKHLLRLIEKQELQLNSYEPSNIVYNSEAYVTLWEIKSILKNPSTTQVAQLTQALEERWPSILNKNCQYLQDFTSPANIVCLALAKMLNAITKENTLCLLMPTLKEVTPEAYLTSSYTDDDLNLQEVILSDDNQRLICIPDVLEYAREDGVLKHNSLVNHRVKELSTSEKTRLMSRHPSVKSVIDSLTARIVYKLEGETVGAFVNRLIIGLKMGGVNSATHYEAKALNATEYISGMDANVAIVIFAEYLATLDEDTKKQLMSAEKIDRYNSMQIERLTIKKIWQRLSNPQRKAHDSIYCVELIADALEEILKENPGLYDLVSYQGTALGDLSRLNESLLSTTETMKQELSTLTRHFCYPEENKTLINRILEKLQHNNIPLRTIDIRLLVELAQSPLYADTVPIIQSIFKNNPCSRAELIKLNTYERQAYLQINSILQSMTSNAARLFNKNKRSLSVMEQNTEQTQVSNKHILDTI